ncbi:MAG: hypothetical protein JW751_07740 [Polyangiaceae bacterium]|nr:hypothetical protein [Polyangiaceae bacterium]
MEENGTLLPTDDVDPGLPPPLFTLGALAAGLLLVGLALGAALLALPNPPARMAPATPNGTRPAAASPVLLPPRADASVAPGCSGPGTRIERGRCVLAPGAQWKVQPFLASLPPRYRGSSKAMVCVGPRRAPLASSCFAATRVEPGRSDAAHTFDEQPDWVGVTTEDLIHDGVRIEVKIGGATVALAERASHPDGIIAGSLLLEGGLVFRLEGPLVQNVRVVLRIQPRA